MAVDTRNKRASALGVGAALALVFPNPDGSLATVADRQQIVRLYSGIEAQDSSLIFRPRFDGQRVTPPEIGETLTLAEYSQQVTPSAPASNSVTPAEAAITETLTLTEYSQQATPSAPASNSATPASPASNSATPSAPGSATATPTRTS